MKKWSTLLAVALAAVTSASCGSDSEEPVGAFRDVRAIDCDAAVLSAAGRGAAECYLVGVPQDPISTDSSYVALHVTRSRATAPTAAPLLVLPPRLNYGVDRMAGLLARFSSYPGDIIIVDYRGTSRTQPGPNCTDDRYERADSGEASRESCIETRGNRYKLGTFHSLNLAADLEAVRKGIGVDRWSVYAALDAGSPAMSYIREFGGAAVNAIVLDGTDSIGPSYDDELVERLNTIDRILTAYSRDCAAQGCQFGSGLKDYVYSRAAKDGAAFLEDIVPYLTSYNQTVEVLAADAAGNRAAWIASHPTERGYIESAPELIVKCNDRRRFSSVEGLENSAKRAPAGLQSLMSADATQPVLEQCSQIEASRYGLGDLQRISAYGVPALILLAGRDPDAPSGLIQWQRRMFPGALVAEFSCVSSPVIETSGNCGESVVLQFLKNPAAPPSVSCRAQVCG